VTRDKSPDFSIARGRADAGSVYAKARERSGRSSSISSTFPRGRSRRGDDELRRPAGCASVDHQRRSFTGSLEGLALARSQSESDSAGITGHATWSAANVTLGSPRGTAATFKKYQLVV